MTDERYARHSLIDWFDQDLVRSQRVIIVGAGAVGNEVIKNLALLGVGDLGVFDRDVIEIHNLTRSVLFREGDLGRAKADCAAARARELDPSVQVTPFVGDFWTTLRLAEIQSATAVFSCVDNFEARIRLSRLCAIAGTPLINIGIDSRFAVVEHFPFGPGYRVPCYECGLPPSAYAQIARRYSCGWLKRVSTAERKIPTTILTSSAAASLAVSVHLRSDRDETSGASWRYFQDTFSGQTTRTEISTLSGCPGCSDLLDQRVIIRAQRRIGLPLLSVLPASRIGPVVLSDRVLTHLRCGLCGADDTATVRFQRADRYDETLVNCQRCNVRSRDVGVREQFDLNELLHEYAGCSIPGKFVATCLDNALQLIVELEGNEDARSESAAEDGRPHAEGRGDHTAQPAGC